MRTPVLFIGNKRYSSWSMRPWLVLKRARIDFEERVIPLDQKETAMRLQALSPAGTVPVLEIEELTIWDSLAIAEWAAEQAPGLWPEEAASRIRARAVAASVHSGFAALRAEASMDVLREPEAKPLSEAALADIARLEAILASVRSSGTFLFGDWSIADAFFTPIATRFHAYRLPASPAAQRYLDTLLEQPDYQAWRADAAKEPWVLPDH